MRTNLDAGACQPVQIVERKTLSETNIYGNIIGTHVDTHEPDGVEMVLFESLSSSGNPDNRYCWLDHRFTIDVAPGSRVQLVVKGARYYNPSADDFFFEWSTDGTTFTRIPMDTLPPWGEVTRRIGEMPPTLSGMITLRVVDSDRTPGNQSSWNLWIDWLVVRSISP